MDENARIERPLGESDLRAMREFLRQACFSYEGDFWDFEYAKDSVDRSPGWHAWKATEYPSGVLGYLVCKRGKQDFKSTFICPALIPGKLSIGLPVRTWLPLLKDILEEPLRVGSFYAVLKKGKICFLTEELFLAERRSVRLEGELYLSREEACAILNGEPMAETLERIKRLFSIAEDFE